MGLVLVQEQNDNNMARIYNQINSFRSCSGIEPEVDMAKKHPVQRFWSEQVLRPELRLERSVDAERTCSGQVLCWDRERTAQKSETGADKKS
jgi:hypothetical protein